jgi:hypothetical protein
VVQTRGDAHVAQMLAALAEQGYRVKRVG